MPTSIWFAFASTVLTLTAMSSGCDSADSSGPPAPGPDEGGDPGTVPVPFQGPQLVAITNTTSEPVPTQAVGTTTVDGTVAATQAGGWNVNVAGGSVGATQSGVWSVGAVQQGAWSMAASQWGPWTVDIGTSPPVTLAPGSSVAVGSLPPVTLAGTPAVTIANTPAVTIANMPNVAVSGTVMIANDDADAIPVRNVTADAVQTPWVMNGQILVNIGELYDSDQFFSVPPGKRLVIEHVNIRFAVPDGQIAFEATLLASAGGTGATMRFPFMPSAGASAAHDYFSIVENTRINCMAGLVVTVSRSGTTGAGIADVAMSGYLVDAP